MKSIFNRFGDIYLSSMNTIIKQNMRNTFSREEGFKHTFKLFMLI